MSQGSETGDLDDVKRANLPSATASSTSTGGVRGVDVPSERVVAIRALLAECSPRGREVWHASGCEYLVSDAQFGCDCMRGDVEFLLKERSRMLGYLQSMFGEEDLR